MKENLQHKTETREFREQWIGFIHDTQDRICDRLEQLDGRTQFKTDNWERLQGKGGGGITRMISGGNVFEKGGVNSSIVYGSVTARMRKALHIDGATWFACGLSLVLHPANPFVPTVHANYRYFELYDREDYVCDRWFGGGTDLTPYYLDESDATHFHQIYKNACDGFDKRLYPLFKKNCDDYFVNAHRASERRGIGGIFFDRRQPDDEHGLDFWFRFCKGCAEAFFEAYIPIAKKQKNHPYGEQQRRWQEIRRGRYVEFNLIHDKGTLFGLKTNGRAESILMSLPPTARFDYDDKPLPGSDEDRLLQVCLHPREWV